MLFLAFFHQNIIAWGIKSYLNSHLPLSASWNVSFAHLELKPNGVCIHDLEIFSSKDKERPLADIKIKNTGFYLGTPNKLTIFRPRIMLRKQKIFFSDSSGTLSEKFSKQIKKWDIRIEEGEVSFKDPALPHVPTFHFAFETPYLDREGKLHISAPQLDPFLISTFSYKRDNLEGEIDIKGGEIDWIAKLIAFLLPEHHLNEYEIQGKLSGKFFLGKENKGGLYVEDFICKNQSRGLLAACKRFSLKTVLHGEKYSAAGEIEEAKIEFTHEHLQDTVVIKDISGSIGINESFGLSGKIQRKNTSVPFAFEGSSFVRKWPIYGCEGTVHFDGESSPKIICSFWNDGWKKSFIDLQLEEISKMPLEILQDILHMACAPLRTLQIREGKINAKSTFIFDAFRLKSIETYELLADHLRLHESSKDMDYFFRDISAMAQIDLTCKDILAGISGEFVVNDGQIFKEKKIFVDDIQLEIAASDKEFHSSWAFFETEGFAIKSSFSGPIFSPDIAFKVETSMQNLGRLGNFYPNRKDQSLHVKGELSQLRHLSGDLQLVADYGESEYLDFQIDLNSPFPMRNYSFENFSEAVKSFTFKGKKLSSFFYSDFISYFLPDVKIEGHIDIKGSINENALVMKMKTDDLTYECPAFRFDNAVFEKADLRWDKQQDFSLTIPFFKGNASEKNFGLIFDSFSGSLSIKDKMVNVKDIVAASDGLNFLGAITYDEGKEDPSLSILTDSIHGDICSFMKFAQKFPNVPNLPMQLQGEIISGQNGFWLQTVFHPNRPRTDWGMQLDVAHGRYKVNPILHVEDIACHIAVDSRLETLQISSLTGQVHVGNEKEQMSYGIHVPKVTISSYAFSPLCEFDMRLETKTYDVVRLVGKAEKEKEKFSLYLNPAYSHFFGSPVLLKECFWKDGNFSKIDISGKLGSNELYQQLDFFIRSGLFPFSLSNTQRFLSAENFGEIQYRFFFDKSLEQFFIAADGKGLPFPAAKDLSFKISKNGREWKIDTAQLGDFSVEGKIFKGEHFWEISYLRGLWKENAFSLIDGNFDAKGKKCIFYLQSLHAKLNDFKTMLPEHLQSYLTGEIDLHGQFKLDFSKGISDPGFESKLLISAKNFMNTAFSAESLGPLFTYYSSKHGWHLENCRIKLAENKEIYGMLSFDRLTYLNSLFKGENVYIDLPPEIIISLAKSNVLPHFTYKNGPCWKTYPFQWENQTKLRGNFAVSRGEACFFGQLEDGYYWLGEKSVDIKNVRFSLDHHIVSLQLDSHLKEKEISMLLSMQMGEDIFSHLEILEKANPQKKLSLEAVFHEEKGLHIQKIEGGFCGFEALFYPSSKSDQEKDVLTGHVKFHADTISSLLPAEFQDMIEKLGMGNGYEMSGDFILDKKKPSRSYFQGHFKGKKFELLGCQFKTMLSEIRADKEIVKMNHFSISDRSMQLTIDRMEFHNQGEGKWKMLLPQLAIQDFRPSLLKKTGKKRDKVKPFYIQDLHFYDVEGILGDRMTFKGFGHLNFTNTFKTEYNLLDIPLEIISRLGLDMKLLVPVQGKLEYCIDEGRIHLTKLKKCYSEGRRSHFYLSPSKPSYMDLDGKLHVNIRMKQYVLLKITELFTLSIRGRIENPSFSLNP
ncbi:MAG: hypothetical protein Tsb0015_15300 [Simkaniaceae bacterium]